MYSATEDDLILIVSRVINDTTLSCLCTPNYLATDSDDLIEVYRAAGSSTYRVLSPTAHVVIKRSTSITNAISLEDNSIITIPRSGSKYGHSEIAAGDDVIIRSPVELQGKLKVLSAQTTSSNHLVTVDRESAISSSSVSLDIVSNTSTSVATSARKLSNSLSTSRIPYESRVTFAPILAVSNTEVSVPFCKLRATPSINECYVLQMWNTSISFLNFDIYEIESPQDEITISFSDGRASITA